MTTQQQTISPTSRQNLSASPASGRRNSIPRLSRENLIINEVLGTMVESHPVLLQRAPTPIVPPNSPVLLNHPLQKTEEENALSVAQQILTRMEEKEEKTPSVEKTPSKPQVLSQKEEQLSRLQTLPLPPNLSSMMRADEGISQELMSLAPPVEEVVPQAPVSPSRMSKISQRLRFRTHDFLPHRPLNSEAVMKDMPTPSQILPNTAIMQSNNNNSVLQNAMNAVMSAVPSSRERKSSNRSFLVSNPERYSRLERIPRIIHQFTVQNWYWMRFVLIGVAVLFGVFIILPAFMAL